MAIYTVGYAAPGSEEKLARLMADPSTLLVDIRLVPTSRWRPQWRKAALSATYGPRYVHLRGLGNVNYQNRTQEIQLLAPEEPLRHLRHLLAQGYSLVLLCACAQEERCHRRAVQQLLLNA